MYLNTNSGFETIHGVLNLLMKKIGAKFDEEDKKKKEDKV